ncbi:MAG: hypothetical protein WAK98_10045 [Gemmobacter sp.]|jgi:hypothetical protein
MIKIVSLFLIAMVVMAIFFRNRIPRSLTRTEKCRSCGRPKIGKGPCPCGADGKGKA